MNPARNYNQREPTEDGCEICGFMKPDFEADEDLYRNYRRRESRGTAEGNGSGRSSLDTFYPTLRQQEPRRYENHACSSFNTEEVRPDWLGEELVRLFPEARNPAPPYKLNDPGCASSSPSDSPTLLDFRHLLPNCYKDADKSDPNHPLSQQQPPGLAPLSLQLEAASIMARDNCAPLQHTQLLPDQNTTTSVQPYRNTVLPEETLPSNTEKLYKSQTTPKTSSHKELPHTKFGAKEMSSSMKTSETTPPTAYSQVSATSNTSSTDNIRNGWKLMKHLSNTRQEEKQSLIDSNVSGTSGKNGNVHGGRSKKTNIVSGTSASGQLQKFSLLSLSREGGEQWCTFCAKNGETEGTVKSHKLYNSETNHIQCPILRAHRCEACNATGDFAHTRSYCPRICMQEGKIVSTALALKSTPRQANGKLRKSKAKNSRPN